MNPFRQHPNKMNMQTGHQMKTSLLILTCLSLLLGTGKAATNNPNTDWFSQAKYGVFMHFLPSGKAGLRQVEQFDVKALAGQLEEMGAG